MVYGGLISGSMEWKPGCEMKVCSWPPLVAGSKPACSVIPCAAIEGQLPVTQVGAKKFAWFDQGKLAPRLPLPSDCRPP